MGCSEENVFNNSSSDGQLYKLPSDRLPFIDENYLDVKIEADTIEIYGSAIVQPGCPYFGGGAGNNYLHMSIRKTGWDNGWIQLEWFSQEILLTGSTWV